MHRLLQIGIVIGMIFYILILFEMLSIQNNMAKYQEIIRLQNMRIDQYEAQFANLDERYQDCADQLGVFYMPIEKKAQKTRP